MILALVHRLGLQTACRGMKYREEELTGSSPLDVVCTVTNSGRFIDDDWFVCQSLSVLVSDKRPQFSYMGELTPNNCKIPD